MWFLRGEEGKTMAVFWYLIVVAFFYGIVWVTAAPDPSSEALRTLARRFVNRRRPTA